MSIVNLSQIAQALDAMMPELTPVPVGTIDFAHDVPEGWLECNGAAVSRTKYARLFKKIGTKYGAGDGSTTFNLPNLHHRVLEGTNTTNEVAKYQEAGLPDITGLANFVDMGRSPSASGAFLFDGIYRDNSLQTANGTFDGWKAVENFRFKASKDSPLHGKSTTNQMASLRLMAIIKV